MSTFPFAVTGSKKMGDYEIKTYNVENVNIDQGDHDMYTLLNLFDSVNKYRTPGTPNETLDEGTLLGMMESATLFRVALKDGKPVGVNIKFSEYEFTDGRELMEVKVDMTFGMKAAFTTPETDTPSPVEHSEPQKA
jgi:hypothetical protein